jgi:outer membrane usher protein
MPALFAPAARRVLAISAIVAAGGMALPARADNADQAIADISVVQQAGTATVRFSFSAPMPHMPTFFALDAPARLVIDFAGIERSKRRTFSFGAGLVDSAALISASGRTRVVLALREPLQPVFRMEGGDLLMTLAPAAPAPAPAERAGGTNEGQHNPATIEPGPRKRKGGEPQRESLLVELTVNGEPVPGIVLAQRLDDGRLALPLEAWQTAGLRPVGAPVVLPGRQPGYALESVPGLVYRIDRARLVLALTVPAGAFDANTVSLRRAQAARPDRSAAGMYVNYGLVAERPPSGAGSFGGAVDAVVFTGAGALVAGAVVRAGQRGRGVTRTDTYWRTDFPGEMRALVIGDAVGGSGGWSRPVRYGGIRYGRDFALAPGYIAYPLPTVSGSAALPSTVDVLVNNQRQSSASVKAGPFDLSNVPVVSGAGEINLLVRDLRGVETVLTQGYYSSPLLLAPGLSDFSAESGALRRNYGGANDDYGQVFAAGSYRYGINSALTVGGRAELQRTRQAGGVEATGLLGTVAVARAAAAWSHSADDGMPARSGARWLAAIERSSPRGGGALQWERFDAGFAQFGADVGEIRPRNRVQANLGLALGAGRSAGLSYVRQANWSGESFSLAGINLGMALAGQSYLSAYASRQLEPVAAWSAGLNLIVPMGNQNTLAATTGHSSAGGAASTVQASHSAPPGEGWGWSVRASDAADREVQAGLVRSSPYGQFGANVNAGAGASAVRVSADGSLGWFEGLPFAAKRIDQGAFAVVRVGDIEGVAVSRSSQVVATTNSRGLAFVPGLLPYQTNVLTLEPDKLPLDVSIGSVKREVVPYARSGVLLDFPARRARNVLVTLRLASGDPVPAGTHVTVFPGKQEFIVAKRGKVYLMDIQGASRIDVRWPRGSCSLPLAAGPAASGETEVGPFICEGRHDGVK